MAQLEELTAEFVGEKWRSDKEPFDFVIAEGRVRDDDSAKTIVLKGNASIGELRANQVYVFLGKHKQYFNRYKGQNEDQFEFSSFIRQEPVSPEAVISYLKEHGEGHGIGVRRCQKLYEMFGTDAISIARDNPERIVEALKSAGLSVNPEETVLFSQSLKSEQATERTRLDLTGLVTGRGFMRSIVSAAIAKWGIKAGYLIRRDPYKLMRLENVGAGFKRCDSVYLDLGLPPAKRKRQALCAWYSIARDTSGSTWFPIDYPAAFLKANISGADVNQEEAIELATRAGYLSEIRTNRDGEIDSEGSYRWFAEQKNHINEAIIANVVVRSRSEPLLWPRECTIKNVSAHQQTELSKALQSPIGILGGSPGTGKTWTVASLVQTLITTLGEDAIGLAAPTGKAAVRISENLASRNLQMRAKTWHSLLMKAQNIAGKKILIGDESSMNDTNLMASIMKNRPTGCHLLLVGDVNQLAPVGHGAPLRDMINAGISYGELREIQRNSGGIVEACAAIRDQQPWDAGDNLIIDECSTPAQQIERALHWLDQAPRSGLNPVWDCQLIVAVNEKSPLSRKTFNPLLQSHLNRQPGVDRIPFRVDDKIVNTANGYVKLLDCLDWNEIITNDRGEVYVANGEQAKVVEISRDRFVAELQSPYRKIEVHFRKQSEAAEAHGNSEESTENPNATEKTTTGCNWDLAYGISLHKAQGSDWPWTIIMIDDYPGAKRICDRSWIYTAISRAKTKCILIGNRKTAFAMSRFSNIHKRKTFLREEILFQSSAYQLAEV
jgi:exodeoxyribonuclease V alpha subunit